MGDTPVWLPLLLRTIVVGILGGTGLVLTHIYSRRGPMIYPVYAAILFALALVTIRFETLSYPAHLSAILAGMLVATAMLFTTVLVLAARRRRALRESGRPMGEGGAPVWGLPLVISAIVAASAAAAYVAS